MRQSPHTSKARKNPVPQSLLSLCSVSHETDKQCCHGEGVLSSPTSLKEYRFHVADVSEKHPYTVPTATLGPVRGGRRRT